jgi:hypothetical protein
MSKEANNMVIDEEKNEWEIRNKLFNEGVALFDDKRSQIKILAIEISARVWCDQEMTHCVMDIPKAEKIAEIVHEVLMDNIGKSKSED